MKKLPVLSKILPETEITNIACSGGLDSMFAFHFLRTTRSVVLVYFDHGTEHSKDALQFVSEQARKYDTFLRVGRISNPDLPKGQSQEEHWRKERYAYLDTLGPAAVVVTGHHLNDAVETWVWSSCHGTPKIPLLVRGNVYRPFLACKKAAMKEWMVKRGYEWIEDPSNQDTDYTRNHIRKNVLPQLEKVNPGLDTVIQKKVCNAALLQYMKS